MARLICCLAHADHWIATPIRNNEGDLSHLSFFCPKCFREWEEPGDEPTPPSRRTTMWENLKPRWLQRLEQKVDDIMATLQDIQAKQLESDGKIALIQTDVANVLKVGADLQASVDELKAIIAAGSGGISPEAQAAIDDIAAHADKINAGLGAIDTTLTGPTPATPPAQGTGATG